MEAYKIYRLDPRRGSRTIEVLSEWRKYPSRYKVLLVGDEEPLKELIVAILSGGNH
jgi:hypothetical protein